MRRGGALAFVAAIAALVLSCAAGTSVTQTGDATTDGLAPDGSHDATTRDGKADACPAPASACNGTCINLTTDPANCGACGHTCGSTMVCNAGACSNNCAGTDIKCSGAHDAGPPKVDASPDALPSDASREAAPSLDASLDASLDGAVDSGGATDATHDVVTPIDAQADAVILDATHGDGGPVSLFDAGMNPTSEYCADPGTDPLNCGGCGIVCPYGPDSKPVCNEGKCGITCSPGYSDCDLNPSNGCESHTSSDPAACGACGNVCSAPNAVPGCKNGTCDIGSCLPGFMDCDMNSANGCETTTTTTQNCGTCGNACPSGPNSTPVCTATGACGLACSPGFADCDHNPTDGCEVNTTDNVGNCGGCGTVCGLSNATPACSGGKCIIASCNAGYADCDMNPADGCEVNTTNDATNCSGCGDVCSTPNGVPACVTGMCAVGMCDTGFADCDGVAANGCETNTNTNVSDCGSCKNVCNLPHATAACDDGKCAIAACDANYLDCNGLPEDGCETLITTVDDCGGCGVMCTTANGSPSCIETGGVYKCGVGGCNAGTANCPGDGTSCSTNIESDPANCGACGNSCETECGGAAENVTATSCTNATCNVTGCASGYIDFDNTCAGGCSCKVAATEAACGNAIGLYPGTIQPGETSTPYSSTMAPLSVTTAYFTVTFGGNTSTDFHPKITITSPSNEFVMDVASNCSDTLLSCGNEMSTSHGVTTWEMQYTAGDPTSYPVTGSAFIAIPAPGDNGQVWIKVYRQTGATPTCSDYTITVSD